PERLLPPEEQPQPKEQPQPEQQPAPAAPAPKPAAAKGPSSWLAPGKYVLLAACRDRELAREHEVREGKPQPFGVFTHFLIRELGRPRVAAASLTYRQLHERVRQQVRELYSDQTPQCEGDMDRAIFGGLRPPRDAYLTVGKRPTGELFVNGGAAHGLTA